MKINKILLGLFFAGFIFNSSGQGQTIALKYSKDLIQKKSIASSGNFSLKIENLHWLFVQSGEANYSNSSLGTSYFADKLPGNYPLTVKHAAAKNDLNPLILGKINYSFAMRNFDVMSNNLNGIYQSFSSSSEYESKAGGKSFFQSSWFYFAGVAVLAAAAYLLWPNKETPRSTGVTFGFPAVPK